MLPPNIRHLPIMAGLRRVNNAEEQMARLIRPKFVYDVERGPLPVGHTRFHEDFALKDESDPFIPHTTVRRIKLVDIGPRARAVDEAEIDRVVAELAALPHKPWRRPVRSASSGRPRSRR
jgi:hypothetical protein